MSVFLPLQRLPGAYRKVRGKYSGQRAGGLTVVPSPCAMPTARAGNAPQRWFTCLFEKLHEPHAFSKASAASLHTLSHSSVFFGWPPRMPITLSSKSRRRWVVLQTISQSDLSPQGVTFTYFPSQGISLRPNFPCNSSRP
jgi:hypothetical protein